MTDSERFLTERFIRFLVTIIDYSRDYGIAISTSYFDDSVTIRFQKGDKAINKAFSASTLKTCDEIVVYETLKDAYHSLMEEVEK